MATGDAASAAGMDLVDDTDEVNAGAGEINKTRDYIAAEQTARIAGDALAFPAAKIIIGPTSTAVVNGAILLTPIDS